MLINELKIDENDPPSMIKEEKLTIFTM